MPAFSRSRLTSVPSLPLTLFSALLFVLVIAGGSTRADVLGQAIVRSFATLVMILSILFGPRPTSVDTKPVWFIVAACTILPVVQLIPLPPALWQALPGRTLFSQAAIITEEAQPWRPLSLVPGATLNAIGSLLVPMATLMVLTQMTEEDHRRLPTIILSMTAALMLIGLLQFSGVTIASPFGDRGPADVNGFFDNRNHFAFMLAIGCIVAPVWAFSTKRRQVWRAPVALGLMLLFILAILATGSRAGVIVGVLALFFGMIIARRNIGLVLARFPRWVATASVLALAITAATVILLSYATNRAESVNRVLTVDIAQDMRNRALPSVWKLLEIYWPVGTGYGSFDPVFRIHEPFSLLSPYFFNHAHNDLLEVIIDGGAAGLVLLGSAIIWWAIASVRIWRPRPEARGPLGKLGSAAILLTLLASAVDYPVRAPLIMAVLTAAAVWLARDQAALTLPRSGRHL